MQLDGRYMTVFDQYSGETYRYTVSGSSATLKRTVQYIGVGDCAQTWIVKGLLYCADTENDDGEVYRVTAATK